MSMSSSSASSSGGGSGHPRQAMGARPKIIAQQQKEEQTGQEWNSNWNPTLSAQGVASNGSQPPSAQCDPPCVVWHRQPGLTRGSSDCSLDSVSASSAWRQQGTQPPGITHHRSGSHLQLSSSNFSSDSSIHSTTQEGRNSRRGGGQLPRVEGSSASSNGISNILRWFKRPARGSSQGGESMPAGRSGGGSRVVHSRSLDNSHPDKWRGAAASTGLKNPPLARSGSGHSLSDSLSTASSFAFIRTPESPVLNGGVGRMQSMNRFRGRQIESVGGGNGNIIRQKYGLYTDVEEVHSDSGGQQIEGAAIRAMRTEWETEMKQMELRTTEECETETNPFYSNYGRNKKRPAPPPPVLPVAAAEATATATTTSTTTATAPAPSKRSSFIHVPGKRRAPSPPPCIPVSNRVNSFNIPVIASPTALSISSDRPMETLPNVASNVPDLHDLNENRLNLAPVNQHRPFNNISDQPRSPKSQNKFIQPLPQVDVVEGAQALPIDEDPSRKRNRMLGQPLEWEAGSKWNDLSGNLNENQNTIMKTQNKFLLQDSALAASLPSDSALPASHKPLTPSNNISRDLSMLAVCSSINNDVRSESVKTEVQPHSVLAAPLPKVIQNTPVAETSTHSSNGILKLEDGILRPIEGAASNGWEQEQRVEFGTRDQKHRRTLPLKPWYKRHGSKINAAGKPLADGEGKVTQRFNLNLKDPSASSHQDEWMPEVPYFRRSLFPSSKVTTLGRKSQLARSGSDGNNSKRKSLLVNISQLDREAEEIIRKEREKALQRKRIENEQFYTLPNQASASDVSPTVDIPSDSSPSGTSDVSENLEEEASQAASTRQLINMFNSFNKTRVTVNPSFAVVEPVSTKPVTDAVGAAAPLPAVVVDVPQINPPPSVPITPSALSPERLAIQAGGARPKRQAVHTIVLNNPLNGQSNDPLNGLVEGVGRWSSDESWTCHICTLLNPNSRLLCNACTALKPYPSILPSTDSKKTKTDHNSNLVTSRSTTVTASLAVSSTSNSYLKWEDEMKKYFNRPASQLVQTDKVAPAALSADVKMNQSRVEVERKIRPQAIHSEASLPAENTAPLKSPVGLRDATEPLAAAKNESHQTTLSDANTVHQPDQTEKDAKVKSEVPDPEALRLARLNFFSSQRSESQVLNGVHQRNGDVSHTPPVSPKGGRKAEAVFPNHTKYVPTSKSMAYLRHDARASNEVKQCNGDISLLPPVSPKAARKTELTSSGYTKISSGSQTHANSLLRLKNDAGRTNQTVTTVAVPHSNSNARFENDASGSSSSSGSNGSSLRRLLVSSPSMVSNGVVDVDVNEYAKCNSSLQLSRFIQQKELAARNQPPPLSKAQSNVPLSPEKRVEMLLSKLEEAIAVGQFDKAAVLAKELAAIKRPTSTPPPCSSSSSSSCISSDGPISSKTDVVASDLAAVRPNSILKKEPTFKTPARNLVPSKAPALPSRTKTDASCSPPMLVRRAAYLQSSPSTTTNSTVAVPIPLTPVAEQPIPNQLIKPQISVEDRQLPIDDIQEATAPILPNLVKVNSIEIEGNQVSVTPVPTQLPISEANRIGEAAVEDTAVNTNEEYNIEKVTITPAMAVQEIIRELDAIPLPVSRHGSSKRKSKVKVDSGQQTTPKFQRTPSVIVPDTSIDEKEEENKTTAFNVDVFIEDRLTHRGPFRLDVEPTTTLKTLKETMERDHNIANNTQRWILGRRLANNDQTTLNDYGVDSVNCSLFLYIVPPVEPKPVPEPIVELQPKVEPQPPQEAKIAHRYYNYEEDRYSTCEESDEEEPLQQREEPTNSGALAPMEAPKPPVEAVREIQDKQPKQVPIETIEPAANVDGWICATCTLLNPWTRPGCEVCARARPIAEGLETPPQMSPPPPQTEPEKAAMNEAYQKLLNLEQDEAVPNAEDFNCSVCLMEVPTGVGVILRDCLHSFCKDCLTHVVELSEEAAVGCPYRDDSYACDSTLQDREIKAIVPAPVYEKHLARSMRLAEKQMRNAFHCQTTDCTGWCIIDDNVNVFRCPVCRQSNCLTCQAIHEGVNCKEYQDQVMERAESNEDAKRTKEMIDALVSSGEALPCPQCQVVLMKRWGCDWVRCSVCRTEICWVTRQNRWGPKGKGDTSGGCRCGVNGVKCHPSCNYCH